VNYCFVLSDGAALLSDGVALVVSLLPADVVSLGMLIDVVSVVDADVVSAPIPAEVVSPVVAPGA